MTSLPAVEDQLVLELKGGKTRMEIVEVFPTCGRCRLLFPLDLHLSHSTRYPGSGDLVRCRQHCAVVGWWQGWWRGRGRADKLLEYPDVEHIMEAGAPGKLQPDNHDVDDLRNAVWPDEARFELAGGGTCQGRRWALSETKEGPVTDLVKHRAIVLVVDTFLGLLCLLKSVADVVEEGRAVLHLLGDSIHARLVGLIRADGRRVAAVDHAKRCLVERRLIGGVVGVLGPRKPVEPLPWTVASEAAEVHDDNTVGGLCLPIRLWVKC
jgi:hypothetical protein